MDLEHIGISDRFFVSDLWAGKPSDACGFSHRRKLADLFSQGQCGGTRSDDPVLPSLRRDLVRVPLLRRNDDLSRYVASDVRVGARFLGAPSLSEKSGRNFPDRTKADLLFFFADGFRDVSVLLYFALDEDGESHPQHVFRRNELFCGVHDVLQKSVLFACLCGKRRRSDRSLDPGVAQGYLVSFRGRMLRGVSLE